MVALKRRMVSWEAVKRAGVKSTRASAKLENRVVPEGHVRSAAVQRYIDEHARGHWTPREDSP